MVGKRGYVIMKSSKVERFGILRLTIEVWGSRTDAERFLCTGHVLLGGKRPIEVMETQAGVKAVRKILVGLRYGLPV